MEKVFKVIKNIPFWILLTIVYTIFTIFYVIFFPLIWIVNRKQKKQTQKFIEEYKVFLSEIEGKEFFCYTSRRKGKKFIEGEVLPHLPPNIEIVYLDGRKIESKLPERFISHALYHIGKKGFPNVMKVINGQIIEHSLHSDLYKIVNQKQSPDLFIAQIHSALLSLREPPKNN